VTQNRVQRHVFELAAMNLMCLYQRVNKANITLFWSFLPPQETQLEIFKVSCMAFMVQEFQVLPDQSIQEKDVQN
jgi:hypothetical protein